MKQTYNDELYRLIRRAGLTPYEIGDELRMTRYRINQTLVRANDQDREQIIDAIQRIQEKRGGQG